MTAIEEVTESRQIEEIALRCATFLGRFTEPVVGGPRRRNRRERRDDSDGRTVTEAGRIAAATRIQRLYRKNKKKAMQQVLNGPVLHCTIDKASVKDHYTRVHANRAAGGELPEVFDQQPPSDVSCDILVAPFSRTVVTKRLWKMSNTSPGPDGITYRELKRADPGCHVLTALFNKINEMETVPLSWKESNTVLLYKKGNRDEIKNWRPISMGNTTAKLHSALMADRITAWAVANGRLSPSQKGFLHFEGCYEHNFVLQEALTEAATDRKELVVAWLDLTNAFPSVPHESIHRSLEAHGLPVKTRNIVQAMYRDTTTRIRTSEGFTDPIPILSGVRQGCPMSPIIFNLALEPVLRAIDRTGEGCFVGGIKKSNLTYADDMALLADSVGGMERLLTTAEEAASLVGLVFNPSKCATLHQKGRGEGAVRPTEFALQGQRIRALEAGEPYEHLGVPTGYQVRQTPLSTIDEVRQDISKVNNSLLAPWQKLDATAVFILPRLDFLLRGAEVEKRPLSDADKALRRMAKSWMGLTQRASAEMVYLPPYMGGGGLTPLADMVDLLTIAHAFRMLTCDDAEVSEMAKFSLLMATFARIRRDASESDCARFLSGSLDADLRRSATTANFWSKARSATRRQSTRLGLAWHWSESRHEYSLECRGPGSQPVVVLPQSKDQIVRRLRTALMEHYRNTLLTKKDQGKVFEITGGSRYSNHFLRTGQFTRFCDWRFIHRARLNCLPLNGARHWEVGGDKRCRKCGALQETLPHVLGHCGVHSDAIQRRHNNIQDRLVKAAKVPGIVNVNKTVEGVTGDLTSLRPDIVIRDDANKKIIIIDIAVPFENRKVAFDEARSRKLEKYHGLAENLREQGYQVDLDAFVVGALGGWDLRNERLLNLLNIKKWYAAMMRRLMISDTIRWSRDMYVEHVSGVRQYRT